MIGVSINPTTLAVGQTGTLDHHQAHVVGRAVLKSSDGYRWYEYYVELEGGSMIILVYEGGTWKRFQEFTPGRAFTAQDAASCRVGQEVALHGKLAQVKYVSASRVLYSEGKTWEGVRAGSQAQYFNAECDGEMIVVSWTGDEIEFYTGKKLSQYIVPQAFHLREPSLWKKFFWGGSGSLDLEINSNNTAIVLVVVFFTFFFWCASNQDQTPPTVSPSPTMGPPSVQLQNGKQGTLEGLPVIVRGQMLVEIDEMGTRFKHYEYDLTDNQGLHALLFEDPNGSGQGWTLFRPISVPAWLVPSAAANLREGASLQLDGRLVKIQRILLSRSLGGVGPPVGARSDVISYGFLAQSGDIWILARWNAFTLDLAQGHRVPDAAVRDAFGLVPNK